MWQSVPEIIHCVQDAGSILARKQDVPHENNGRKWKLSLVRSLALLDSKMHDAVPVRLIRGQYMAQEGRQSQTDDKGNESDQEIWRAIQYLDPESNGWNGFEVALGWISFFVIALAAVALWVSR